MRCSGELRARLNLQGLTRFGKQFGAVFEENVDQLDKQVRAIVSSEIPETGEQTEIHDRGATVPQRGFHFTDTAKALDRGLQAFDFDRLTYVVIHSCREALLAVTLERVRGHRDNPCMAVVSFPATDLA